MVKKFFDPSVTEPAGATSIAGLMAKQGVMNETSNPVAAPITIPEIKEETTAEGGTPVETTTDLQPTETAIPETPSQVEEIKQAEAITETAEPAKVQTLQEVLGKHQPEAILKQLGYDDNLVGFLKDLKSVDPKMVAFFNTWKSNGDINGYLRELTTDYTKMPAEEVMRHQLRQEYPTASERAIDVLYKKEVVEKYNLDSTDEIELEEGRLLLEAKADRFRSDFVNKQQEYLLPKPPEPKAPEPDNSEQVRQQEIEAYKSKILSNDFTKNIISTKQFSLGDGTEKFSFPVEPSDITDVLFDSEKWVENLYEKDGSPKVEHQLLVGMVAKYGMKFLNEYAKHYKSLGGKAVIEPLENAKPPETATPSPTQIAPKSAAEAMARQGVLNSGGY